MKRRNNLDEMQEQRLLHIESRGYWLAFWGLAAALIIQLAIYGPDADYKLMLPEWIVFMGICLYMVIGCIKAGIWDRALKPNFKDNVLMSVLAGLLMGVVQFIISFRNYHKPIGSVAAGIFTGIIVMVLCFAALSVCASVYKKRQEKLEKEDEE